MAQTVEKVIFCTIAKGLGKKVSKNKIGGVNRIHPSESGDFRAPIGSLAREIVTLFLIKFRPQSAEGR